MWAITTMTAADRRTDVCFMITEGGDDRATGEMEACRSSKAFKEQEEGDVAG
jgi:hypothetical protein